MHRLLERQLKRYFGRDFNFENLDENLINLLKDISEVYINNEKEKSFFEKLFKKVEKYRNDMLDNKNKFYERELYAQKEKEYEKAKEFLDAFEDLKESIKNDE